MNQPKEYCIWVDVIKCYRRFEDDWRFGKSQVRWRCYQSRVAPGALPWQSSGYDSVFLPPRARFWSLVQKLRSNKPSEVAQSCPTLFGHMDYVLLGSSIHGIFQARVLEWVAISLSRGSSQPRDWIRISRIVGRCFTEPPGKPQWCGKKKKKVPSDGSEVKVTQLYPALCDPMDNAWNSLGQNTGVGSLSLLQGIFPIQGSNPGLLHCRWILYQLSHSGNPQM